MPKFKEEHEGVCLKCAEGKLTRGQFPSSNNKIIDILQFIHFDISSMMLVNSLGGYLYYLTFMDDYYHKTWICLFKKKDKVFTWFSHFKSLIKN